MVDLILLANLVLVLALSADAYRRLGGSMAFHGFSLYLAFHSLVFTARPFLTYHFGFNSVWMYMGVWPTEREYVFNLLLAMFGLACCYVGFVVGHRPLPAGLRLNGYGKQAGWPSEPSDIIAFVIVAAIFLPVGFYALREAKDIHENMVMGAGGVRIFKEGSGYIAYAYHAIGPILLLFAAIQRFRLWSLLPLLLYVAYRIEIGWGRFGFILLLMSLGLVWAYLRGIGWRVVGLGGVALVLFQYAGRSRAENSRGAWYSKLDSLDFANFDFLTFITRQVPEGTGTFTYFSQYSQILTEPIPRALWADKPVGPPIQFFDLNQYGNFIGLTNSLVGDGWMSLGYVGVATTLGLTGFLTSKAFNWFVSHKDDRTAVLIYAIALPAAVTWFRDGGINVFKQWMFLAIPVIIWASIAQYMRTRKRARRAFS